MNQKEFNKYLYEVIANASAPSLAFLSEIKDSLRLSPARAIEVYREDYNARLSEALADTYRALNFLLGDEDFYYLCQDYIAKYPSYSPNLDDYGENLAVFITSHSLAKRYSFLFEMASFEWNFRLLFHQKARLGLNQEELQSCLIHNCPLELVSTAQLESYSHLISKLYACKDHEAPEAFDFHQQEFIVVYKHEQDIMTKELHKSQWIFLCSLADGKLFQEAFEVSGPEGLDALLVEDLFVFLGTSKILKKRSSN